jgi:hypothetical protein
MNTTLTLLEIFIVELRIGKFDSKKSLIALNVTQLLQLSLSTTLVYACKGYLIAVQVSNL